MRGKKSFSLMEVVISLGLALVLVSTLFFWYHALSQQKQQLLKVKEAHLEERYGYQRLQHLLLHAEQPFFTKSQPDQLIFVFDRGPAITPQLSNKVIGSLYLDPKIQCLCLTIWPYTACQEEWLQAPSQTVIVLDAVESWELQFYSPPEYFQPVNPDEIGEKKPEKGWQKSWRLTYEQLPALIKMHLIRTRKDGLNAPVSIEYTFDLPIPIAYPISS